MYKKASVLGAVYLLMPELVGAMDLKIQALNEITDNFLTQVITGLFFVLLVVFLFAFRWLYKKVTGKYIETGEYAIGDIVVVSRFKRLANFSIDFFIVINGLTTGIVYFIIVSENYNLLQYAWIIGMAVIIIYYTGFEYLIGRTLGKLFTNTKVVTETGERMSFSNALGRTIIRLIPFEAFSYLGKNELGWHDKWSKTLVVRVEKVSSKSGVICLNPNLVLNEDDDFSTQKEGDKVEPKDQERKQSPIAAQENELNRKRWYRLLKVVYGIAFVIISGLVVIYIIEEYKPVKVLDTDRSYIQCSEGKTFTATELGVPSDGKPIGIYFSWSRLLLDKDSLRRLCVAGRLDNETPLTFEQFTVAKSLTSNNYTVVENYKAVGSWLTVGLLSLGVVFFVALLLWVGRRLFFYIYNDPSSLEPESDYPKVHNVAGIGGITESPEESSVGEAISDEGMFRTIRLLPEGEYDGHDELGDAVVHYNRSDLRSRGNNYADGVQDTFGLISLVESGLVAIYSKRDKQFLSEIKKATYTTQSEERDRYFFPDGTCFFDIRTTSFRPSFK